MVRGGGGEWLEDGYDEYDEYDEDWVEQEPQEDTIEVYDETGNLIGTYTDEEWTRMRREKGLV